MDAQILAELRVQTELLKRLVRRAETPAFNVPTMAPEPLGPVARPGPRKPRKGKTT